MDLTGTNARGEGGERDAHPPTIPRWRGGPIADEAHYLRVDPHAIILDPELGNVRRGPVGAEEADALASSIRQDGILQAPAVRITGPDDAPILLQVWGGRRIEAARRVGLPSLVVRNLGRIDNSTALLFQLIENHHSEALHPVDEALATMKLARALGSGVAVAARLGRSESWVSQMRRVGEAVESLEEDEQEELYVPALSARVCFEALLAASGAVEQGQWILRQARKKERRKPGRPEGRKGKRQRCQVRRPKRGGGEVFTVRWEDADLASNPAAVLDDVLSFLDERLAVLRKRVKDMREPADAPERETDRRPHPPQSPTPTGPEPRTPSVRPFAARSPKKDPETRENIESWDKLLRDFDKRREQILGRTPVLDGLDEDPEDEL